MGEGTIGPTIKFEGCRQLAEHYFKCRTTSGKSADVRVSNVTGTKAGPIKSAYVDGKEYCNASAGFCGGCGSRYLANLRWASSRTAKIAIVAQKILGSIVVAFLETMANQFPYKTKYFSAGGPCDYPFFTGLEVKNVVSGEPLLRIDDDGGSWRVTVGGLLIGNFIGHEKVLRKASRF